MLSVHHIACPDSLGTVNHPYQLTVYGNTPSPKFLGATEGPALQAGLSKDSSLEPAMVALFYTYTNSPSVKGQILFILDKILTLCN